MDAPTSTSKKESAANSALAQLRNFVFFTDRGLGRRVVPSALRDAGATVEIMDDHFPPDVEDTEWVPKVGSRGWIILSKDKHLRSNPLEQIALLKSNTHSFLLTSAGMTGPQNAKAFVTALPAMVRMIQKFPPPFIATITPSGAVNVFFTHDQLLKTVGENLALPSKKSS
jgi:hypothetical protein